MGKAINILTAFIIASSTQFAMAESIHTQLTPKTEQTLQSVDSSHFSGKAAFARLPTLPSNGDVAPAIVHFETNSFTDWHTHSQGQYLIVTDGSGRFQEWDKPMQTITKGDVVWIAPNVKHWHGAGEFTAMSHIAISPVQGNAVTWLEKVQPEKAENIVKTDKISGNHLSAKQLSIIPLAIAVTQGDQATVKTAIEQGLKAGLTVSELKEAVSHQFAYIGAPKTLNGLITLKSVLENRAKQGINDPQGKLATELGNVDYYQLGTEKLASLTNRPTQTPIFEFAPVVDYAIKAQLFGYQFSRDNLGDVERELTTIGSLVGLGESVNAQLRSHLSLMKNLGLTETSFKQLTETVNSSQAQNLRNVWAEVNRL
ncbi:cupin domain-containing carboxymuconolactone decarboxylase family protein [Entomomonas asaccharolytica]|uniref:Carboxymuconolactone decarboxylase family protein n=1 Tax=Entomomonas asaccharolytica TaxID=2785331 RepID=A0A974NG91_9GAMM|nr:carboxymuconolactone decarboxylase family protein [Entomomonas asaccharolytica]QQP86050.1 carboxymuconolactone decarboxylase family protein [Entomomonas asaccharolytica]